MSYKHILVAVDLTDESKVLIDKAVSLAKGLDAKVSFIHIDINYAEVYTGLIDLNMTDIQHHAMEASHHQLSAFAEYAAYPITHTLISSGDLTNELCENIQDYDVDLLVCGHHQDFWSKFLSTTRQLINHSPVDTLVIPIRN